ncbi:MAG: S1 RNA-binding domain-containing protein [Clostridiales bacterium]|nr:S1 RNA-binding domain-containing protein [Clostridiales bacterium]MDY3745937.1 S1 RNA-binding domain-containing protein [Lachnospiraceae bacterium]
MEEEKVLNEETVTEEAPVAEEAPVTEEPAESMDDYKDTLNASFKKLKEGDIITGQIIGVSDTEVAVDLNAYCEGIIKIDELSNDPRFSIKSLNVGDAITAVVIQEDDGEGNILLSRKKADDELAWSKLSEMMSNDTVLTLKIGGIVNAGVIAYVEGIRGFIPASQLSTSYVEDLNEWLNKTVEAKIITVDPDKKRLVLSAKAVARDKEIADKNAKINRVQVGDVFDGTVDKITNYGAFVTFADDLSGLVHISQISTKRLKSVHEVLKEGDAVKVKVIANKDGKISLSIKALQAIDEVTEIPEEVFDYKEEGQATTGLAALLKNIKL